MRSSLPLEFSNGHILFVITTAAGLASAVSGRATTLSFLDVILLLSIGIVYSLLGTYGFELVVRSRSFAYHLAYLGVQLSLCLGAFYLAPRSGSMWVMALPLVAQAVLSLKRAWAGLFALTLLAVIYGIIRVQSTAENALQGSLSYGAGMVFVAMFTQLANREQQARTEVETLAAELQAANQKLRAYAVQAEELATINERNRLAREIHDSLGHYLTVIHVQIGAAKAVLESKGLAAQAPQTLEALNKAQKLAHEGLAEVRRSVAALRASPTDNRTLPQAVEDLAAETRATGVLTELTITGEARPLAPQMELTLYRAAQEALTNARKYAHASLIEMRLAYTATHVRLTVRDNGVGRETETASGFGLMGVGERAHLLGGTLRVTTAKGAGFTLDVELPISEGDV